MCNACPTQALKFLDESEAKGLMRKGEVPFPEYKAEPRVYYVNTPRKFIAGTIYDPIRKEIIKGATCTLTEKATAKQYQVLTDEFGDFWFQRLEGGEYALRIGFKGFITRAFDLIATEKDVNLGDIPLNK